MTETVTIHAGREARAAKQTAGDLSFYHFRRLFATKENSYSWIQFYEPFRNTLIVSLAASLIAIVFGGAVAFVVTRTNIKYTRFISAVFTFPNIMPSWTLALFWENFFKNVNIGLKTSNGIMAAVFGVYMPEWFVYGAFPIALVLGLHYAPYAYILIGSMLRNFDANLEEAATLLRTVRSRVIWRITLPMIMPAILSTFLLVFASAMSAYSVPIFLGAPVRFYMLSTKMKSLMDSYPGQAYIIAAVMILLGVFILMLNQRVTNSRKQFTTVTGKSVQIRKINLGKRNINLPPIKRNVGFLFQNNALWPHMTVYQNVAFGLENLKWDESKVKERVNALLAMLRIEQLENRFPNELFKSAPPQW
ncbi:MAG: ABC transporter permease subunit [Clostridia bacterium]|nr:ABC transporter permease subunit [Clostridia bacterium]